MSSRGPAPSKTSVASQLYFADHGKTLQYPTPRLKIYLPCHSLPLSQAADTPCGTKDSGSTETVQAILSPLPPAPSTQAGERAPRSSSLVRTSPKKQKVSHAVEGTNGAVCRPSTSTAPQQGAAKAGGCPYGRLAGFPRRLWTQW